MGNNSTFSHPPRAFSPTPVWEGKWQLMADWLIDSGDSVRVLAHVTCMDKTQAITAVPLDDVAHPVVLSQGGIAGAGRTSFASFGLPATNAEAQEVFLGSLT
jgi:hypothetical protein